MSKPLAGRVAIVTGAGRGIGRSIATALSEQGAFVGAISRTPAEIYETVRSIEADGGEAAAFEVDVADHEAVMRFVAGLLDSKGRVDILVNNAGVQGPIGPLVTNDWHAWYRNISVNLFGMFNCCQAVLPTMIAQRTGKIVNLSGGGATGPRPNFSAYSAAKAAVVRLTETLAEEVREHNIQVNVVAPGAVNTRMLDELLQAGESAGTELADALKRQRDGGTSPDIAARLIAFLASDESLNLTGKLIAAPHDDWPEWDEQTIGLLDSSPWLTLRRLDPFTLAPLTSTEKNQTVSAVVNA